MSNRNVDERIVEMQFDNRQFESNVKTSLGTLEKLKKGLQLDESAESLKNLERAGNSFSLAHIADSVDQINNRFSVFGEFTHRIFSNIMNEAVQVGSTLINALSLDAVRDGYAEYEEKIGSIQGILTNTKSKGTTLDDVTEALNELNLYADQTIYSFADMTKAIMQFTTAGVGLEDAKTAIKGFSNLAAGVGADNADLTRAEYQMSQALNSNYIRLMDWRSLMNTKGLGGEYMQQALIATAKELKKDVPNVMKVITALEKKEISFYQSLNQQDSPNAAWLTTDVFLETLKRFADDPALLEAATKVRTFSKLVDTLKEALGSGWAQSVELIIGNFDEATNIWSAASDVLGEIINEMAILRNGGQLDLNGDGELEEVTGYLQYWHDNGGRATLIDTAKMAWQNLLDIFGAISTEYRKIFPALTGEKLMELTARLYLFVASLRKSDEQLNKIRGVFSILFSVVKGIGKLFKTATAIAKPFVDVIKEAVGAISAESLFGISQAIDTFVDNIGISEEALDGLKRGFSGILQFITAFARVVWNAASSVFNFVNSLGLFDKFAAAFGYIGDALASLSNGTAEVSMLGKVLQVVKKAIGGVVNVFKVFGTSIRNLITKIKSLKSVNEVLRNIGAAFQNLWNGISPLVENIKEWIRTRFTDAEGHLISFGEVFERLRDRVETAGTGISNAFRNLFGKDISDVFAGIRNAFNKLIEFIGKVKDRIVEHFKNIEDADIKKAIGTGSLIAIVLAYVAFVVKSVKTIDSIKSSAKTVTDVLESLKNTIESWQKGVDPDNIKDIGKAILYLAGALLILSVINVEGIWPAVGALGAVILAIGIFLKILSGINKISAEGKKLSAELGTMKQAAAALAKASLGVLLIAAALAVLADTFEGKNPWAIVGSIIAIIAIIGAIGLAAWALKHDAGMIDAASVKAFGRFALALGASFWLIAKAFKILGDMKSDDIGEAILMFAISAIAIGLIMSAMKQIDGDALKAGAGLFVMSIAIAILMGVLKNLTANQLTAIAGGLLEIAAMVWLFTKFMDSVADGGDILKAAFAMIVLSVALGMFIGTAAILSHIPFADLAKGFILIAISIALMCAFILGAKGTGTDALKASAAVGILSLALLFLSGAVKKFAAMDFGAALKGFLLMAIGLGIMAGGVWLISKTKASAKTIAVAAAIFILAAAIGALAAVPLVAGAAGILLLAIALVALGAVMALFSTLGVGMVIVAAAFLVIAIAGVVFAASILVLDAALTAMLPLLYAFGEMDYNKVIKAFDIMSGLFETIAKGLLKVGGALIVFGLGLIVTGVGIAAVAIGVLVLGVSFAVASVGVVLMIGSIALLVLCVENGGADMMQTITTLSLFFLDVIQLFLGWIPGVGNAIDGAKTKFIDALNDLPVMDFSRLFPSDSESKFTKALGDVTASVAGAGGEMKSSLLDGFGDGLGEDLGSIFGKNVEGSSAFGSDILGSFSALGSDSGNSFLNSFSGVLGGEGGVDLTSMLGGNGDLGAMLSGEFNAESLLGGFDLNSMLGGEGGAFDLSSLGMGSADSWMSSFTGGMEGFDINNFMSSDDFDLSQFGFDGDMSFMDGIMNGSGEVSIASGDMAQAAADAANEKKVEFENAGTNAVTGYSGGIRSAINEAVAASMEMANASYNATCETLGIHSPSRLFEEGGVNSVLGFIKGIFKKTPKAEKAAKDMGFAALDGLEIAMLQGKSSLQPEIRPVVDMEEAKGTVSRVREMMDEVTRIVAQKVTRAQILDRVRNMIATNMDKLMEHVNQAVADAKTALDTQTEELIRHKHDGTIRIEGVNDEHEYVAASEVVYDDLVADLRRESRIR